MLPVFESVKNNIKSDNTCVIDSILFFNKIHMKMILYFFINNLYFKINIYFQLPFSKEGRL